MNKTTLISTSVVFFASLLTAACEKTPEEAPEVVRPVRIITISSLQGGDTLNYPGEIQGAQNVNIAFEVPGRIIEMPAQEGIDVSGGDMLARLDGNRTRQGVEGDLRPVRGSVRARRHFRAGARYTTAPIRSRPGQSRIGAKSAR